METANSVSSMHFSTSAMASPRVLPFSSLTRVARSCICFSSRCLYRKRICTRSLIGVRLQAGKAALAELTASSRSAPVEQGISASRDPSRGEITDRLRADETSVKAPLIKFWRRPYLALASIAPASFSWTSGLFIFVFFSVQLQFNEKRQTNDGEAPIYC